VMPPRGSSTAATAAVRRYRGAPRRSSRIMCSRRSAWTHASHQVPGRWSLQRPMVKRLSNRRPARCDTAPCPIRGGRRPR
jgi:hypothetical protein